MRIQPFDARPGHLYVFDDEWRNVLAPHLHDGDPMLCLGTFPEDQTGVKPGTMPRIRFLTRLGIVLKRYHFLREL